MNRREALLALGLAACGAPAKPPRPPRPPRPSPKPTDPGRPVPGTSCECWGTSLYQTSPNPLAFHGDILVQWTEDELRFWNATSMMRIDTLAIPALGFCVLLDGTVAAVVQRSGASSGELHHFDHKRGVEILRGPVFMAGRHTRVLPGAAANEIYITLVEDHVVQFRIGKTTLEEGAWITLDIAESGAIGQLIRLDDGRLIAPDGQGLRVLQPGKPAVRFETRGQFPIHLAAVANNRCWYSYATKTARAHSVVLARLGEKLIADTRIDVGPARVVHLAAHPGAVALLLHTDDDALKKMVWSVVVITDDGKERWRVDVPVDATKTNLDSGFVAISEKRVVLSAGKDMLLGWDASTGRRI